MRIDPALREFCEWRTRDAEYSLQTRLGEMPGLLYFVDFCHERGADTVDAIDDTLCRDWKRSLTHLQPNTVATRLGQLRAFLGYCRSRGWLTGDPTVLLRAARPAPEPRERLSARELLDVIEAADYPQHRIILALAANLALRQSEIKTLRVRDVDLDAGSLLVHVHKTADTAPDPMPITAELDAELRRWLAHYTRACPVGRDSLLVPAQHVDGRFGKITYRTDRSVAEPEDVVKRALGKLGWTEVKGEGIHTVRRSVARIYFDAALDEVGDTRFDEVVLGTMRLLHHDRPETTLRYIGIDRQTQARDRFLRGRSFLPRLAGAPSLALVK
jgi:integrase